MDIRSSGSPFGSVSGSAGAGFPSSGSGAPGFRPAPGEVPRARFGLGRSPVPGTHISQRAVRAGVSPCCLGSSVEEGERHRKARELLVAAKQKLPEDFSMVHLQPFLVGSGENRINAGVFLDCIESGTIADKLDKLLAAMKPANASRRDDIASMLALVGAVVNAASAQSKQEVASSLGNDFGLQGLERPNPDRVLVQNSDLLVMCTRIAGSFFANQSLKQAEFANGWEPVLQILMNNMDVISGTMVQGECPVDPDMTLFGELLRQEGQPSIAELRQSLRSLQLTNGQILYVLLASRFGETEEHKTYGVRKEPAVQDALQKRLRELWQETAGDPETCADTRDGLATLGLQLMGSNFLDIKKAAASAGKPAGPVERFLHEFQPSRRAGFSSRSCVESDVIRKCRPDINKQVSAPDLLGIYAEKLEALDGAFGEVTSCLSMHGENPYNLARLVNSNLEGAIRNNPGLFKEYVQCLNEMPQAKALAQHLVQKYNELRR